MPPLIIRALPNGGRAKIFLVGEFLLSTVFVTNARGSTRSRGPTGSAQLQPIRATQAWRNYYTPSAERRTFRKVEANFIPEAPCTVSWWRGMPAGNGQEGSPNRGLLAARASSPLSRHLPGTRLLACKRPWRPRGAGCRAFGKASGFQPRLKHRGGRCKRTKCVDVPWLTGIEPFVPAEHTSRWLPALSQIDRLTRFE